MIVLYTRSHPFCSYCENAKRLLNSKAIPFEERQVGEVITVEELKEQFEGVTTLPVVTINGVYIGGFKELQHHLSDPELLVE